MRGLLLGIVGILFLLNFTGCVHTQQIYTDRKLTCVKELLEQGVEAIKAAKVCGEIYDRK